MLVLGWPILLSAWPILVSGWPIFVSAWLLGFCLADLGFGLTDLGLCLTHLDASKQCFQLSWNISTKSLLEKPFFSCLSNLFGQLQEEPVESHKHFLQLQLLQLSFEHFLVFKWPIPVIKVFILSHKILYLSTKFSCRPMADSISSLSLWRSSADMAFVSSVWQSDWGSIPCPLNKSAQSHTPRKSLQLVKTKTPHRCLKAALKMCPANIDSIPWLAWFKQTPWPKFSLSLSYSMSFCTASCIKQLLPHAVKSQDAIQKVPLTQTWVLAS